MSSAGAGAGAAAAGAAATAAAAATEAATEAAADTGTDTQSFAPPERAVFSQADTDRFVASQSCQSLCDFVQALGDAAKDKKLSDVVVEGIAEVCDCVPL